MLARGPARFDVGVPGVCGAVLRRVIVLLGRGTARFDLGFWACVTSSLAHPSAGFDSVRENAGAASYSEGSLGARASAPVSPASSDHWRGSVAMTGASAGTGAGSAIEKPWGGVALPGRGIGARTGVGCEVMGAGAA